MDLQAGTLRKVRAVALERLGRRVAPGTIVRWIKTGCSGVKLRAVKLGGSWHTNDAEFDRFIRDQTAASARPQNPPIAPAERPASTTRRLQVAGVLD